MNSSWDGANDSSQFMMQCASNNDLLTSIIDFLPLFAMTTASTRQIWIYDTTLRDGAQREGLALSLEDKLRIARQIDRLGVPFIEGGWPGANPKDVQFFWQLQEEPLTQAELVAFCATRRPGLVAAEDPMLQPILAAGTRWVTIFGKAWYLHVT